MVMELMAKIVTLPLPPSQNQTFQRSGVVPRSAVKMVVNIIFSLSMDSASKRFLLTTSTCTMPVQFLLFASFWIIIGLGADAIRNRRDPNRIVHRLPTSDEWKSYQVSTVRVLRKDYVFESIEDLLPENDAAGEAFDGLPTRFATHSKQHRAHASNGQDSQIKETRSLMIRAPHPFSGGWLRRAYYGKLGSTSDLQSTNHTTLVLKALAAGEDLDFHVTQMEISKAAQYLATLYNKHARPLHCPEIKFLQVSVLTVLENETLREDKVKDGKPGPTRYKHYAAEPLLPTKKDGYSKFIKFNNCMGNWPKRNHIPNSVLETLLRFTVFVYQMTDGRLMVADLQGVFRKKDGNVVLTDPAMLSEDARTKYRDPNNFGYGAIVLSIQSAMTIAFENGWIDLIADSDDSDD